MATLRQKVDITQLIQMAKEIWRHSQCTVTWLTRMELAWQWSVTTVKTGIVWKDLKDEVATHVIFITQEPVYLNWPVSPVSPHAASSLSSTSVTIQVSGLLTIHTDGGCHVILLRWPTGVEHHLAVASVHAGWTTHAQIPTKAATVIRMTMYGVKTAVSSPTRQSFQ